MSQTLACYNNILPAFCIAADDEGRLSQKTPTGTLSPLSIGGQRLVLPTKQWLKKGFGEEHLPFHPLCEVMSREGTSPVIQLLQRQAKAVIAYNMISLVQGLLRVAVDKDTHKDLPIECTDFLKKLSNADKATYELLDKLIAAATKKGRLLTVYLKNGGKYDGKKVNRSCIIRFPIMEDLQSDSKDVLGIVIPKKQRPTLVALFKLVLPFGDNAEEYSFGTLTRVAPYFTALLTAYHKVATVLNQTINQYGEALNLPVKPLELFDLDELDSFGKIFNELPAFKGNEGSTKDQPEEASETIPSKAEAKKPTAYVAQETRDGKRFVEASDPAPSTSSRGASMADLMNVLNPQAQQQQHFPPQNYNQYMPQPIPNSFAPAPNYGNGGYNGFNNTTGYNPTPVNYNQNPYAPAPMVAPWEQQPGQWGNAPISNNPFMAATPSGQAANRGLI